MHNFNATGPPRRSVRSLGMEPMKIRRLIFAVVVGVTAAVYLYESHPKDVVVTSNGRIQGPVNRVRAWIQGERFWSHQLAEAKIEMNRMIVSDAQQRAQMSELSQVEAQTAQLVQDFIARSTNLTAVQRNAATLRATADRIEQVDGMRSVDQYFQQVTRERLVELQRIIAFIQARVGH